MWVVLRWWRRGRGCRLGQRGEGREGRARRERLWRLLLWCWRRELGEMRRGRGGATAWV